MRDLAEVILEINDRRLRREHSTRTERVSTLSDQGASEDENDTKVDVLYNQVTTAHNVPLNPSKEKMKLQ